MTVIQALHFDHAKLVVVGDNSAVDTSFHGLDARDAAPGQLQQRVREIEERVVGDAQPQTAVDGQAS
jgi:hypothetical protein